MLQISSNEAGTEVNMAWASSSPCPDWQQVDSVLRSLAARRAALDADEAHWLREAEACKVWRPLGMVSAIDYMERVLGYSPRAAQDRLRVARALGALPQLTDALAHGELLFTAVRELTRVATPATEAAWRVAATGKNARQVEELVAGHSPGDGPDDPADPNVRTRVVRFELSAETFAALRQVRQVLNEEHGSHLTDDELVSVLCNTILDGAPTTEATGRAKFQIATVICARCRQGWQEGAGTKVAISPAAVERAECDAQHIGAIDRGVPERARQDVPPNVVRFVWRRDEGRCRIPGCRSSRGLEIHHLVRRADGGDHHPSNLVLACSSCHTAHHDGAISITGTADHIVVKRRREPNATDAHVGADHPATGAAAQLEDALLRDQAKQALVGLGWKPAVAGAAVAAAAATPGACATLEQLVAEALRRCPRPE